MRWLPLTWIDAGYEVSDEGLVRSWLQVGAAKGTRRTTPRSIKTFPRKDGYRHVSLMTSTGLKSFLVHRLILQAFTGETGTVCNHKNGIKNDNRVVNLEWSTYSKNQLHSYAVLGRLPSNGGRGKPKRKKEVAARAGK